MVRLVDDALRKILRSMPDVEPELDTGTVAYVRGVLEQLADDVFEHARDELTAGGC